MNHFRLLLTFLLLIISTTHAQHKLPPSPFNGRVVRIMDGDTYEVLAAGNTLIRVRMMGIDAPEKNQPFGQRSKQTLGLLCGGQIIQVRPTGVDRYGRVLAYSFNSQGMNINEEMVRRGMAWHYKQFSNDPSLADAEDFARIRKLGLWSDPYAMPPWDFRKSRRRGFQR